MFLISNVPKDQHRDNKTFYYALPVSLLVYRVISLEKEKKEKGETQGIHITTKALFLGMAHQKFLGENVRSTTVSLSNSLLTQDMI